MTNYLTADDLNDLIRICEDNNQYNDEYDKAIWEDILVRLIQEYRHCSDDL